MNPRVLCILILLTVRHLPQLAIDVSNLRRQKIAICPTPARSEYIVLQYLAICICTLLSVQFGAHKPTLLDTVGFALFAFGVALGLAGILTLGRSYSVDISLRADFRLVTSGIYSLIRHPIRLGLIAEPLGLLMMSGMPILALPWVGMLCALIIRSRQEDVFLRHQVGIEVAHYQSTVPGHNLPLGIWLKVGGMLAARRGTRNMA